MARAERSIEINASPADCYKVITDFAAYPEFTSDLKGVRVLERTGEVFKVEFTVQIMKEVKYVLDLRGRPGEGLSWTLLSSTLMKKNDGGWKLEEIRKGVTKATYFVDLDLGLFVPKTVINMLLEQSFPKMLKQFKERIEGA